LVLVVLVHQVKVTLVVAVKHLMVQVMLAVEVEALAP
jgi:hypothetical protein